MIESYGSLYAGHVDFDHIGFDAAPVNERWLSEEALNTVYSKAESIAKVMDINGFDIFWLAEHHFQPEGYECIPNVLMTAVHLSHLTENIRLGCGFNIAPMWHPLRLAEDYATADILTNGRVVFGVGRGYHTREVETVGVPLMDQVANRNLFEEQVEVIFKAFNNDSFSHNGENYSIPPNVPYRGYELREITLVPRPLRRPVECWQPIQSATPRGMDFMAKHGINGIIGGGSSEGGAMDQAVLGFQKAYHRSGHEIALGDRLSIGFHYHIADTQKEATDQIREYYEENLKIFGPLRLVRALSETQIEIMANPKLAPFSDLPTAEEAVEAGGILAGPPSLILEQQKKLEARYPGLERVAVSHPVGTPQSVITEQLQRFAEDVIPEFTR